MMKNKLSNFLKENRWLIITFLLSSIIISVIYTFNKIAPFGNNSMLDVDFYHQYGPLLNELYDLTLYPKVCFSSVARTQYDMFIWREKETAPLYT